MKKLFPTGAAFLLLCCSIGFSAYANDLFFIDKDDFLLKGDKNFTPVNATSCGTTYTCHNAQGSTITMSPTQVTSCPRGGNICPLQTCHESLTSLSGSCVDNPVLVP